MAISTAVVLSTATAAPIVRAPSRRAVDAVFAARATAWAEKTLYAYQGRPLVDAKGAARLEAAMAARALPLMGRAPMGPFAPARVVAKAADAFGVSPSDAATPRIAGAPDLTEWVAQIAFGPLRADEDPALRARFAELLLVDLATLPTALAETLAPDQDGAAVADLALADRAAHGATDGARAILAALRDGVAPTGVCRTLSDQLEAARGVMNSAELNRAAGVSLPVGGYIDSGLKRGFDIVVSLAMLIGLSPLILGVLIMMLFEKGPVFFAHQRVGRGGRLFPCFKFRTMVPDAQAKLDAVLAADPALAREWAETQKLRNDPRITPLGWFLRKTSVDELPQLLNVLRGEMTLVGARPIIASEADRWGAHFVAYKSARPGLTGPWQLYFRSTGEYRRRFEMLDAYFARGGLIYDLKMMALTALTPFDIGKAA